MPIPIRLYLSQCRCLSDDVYDTRPRLRTGTPMQKHTQTIAHHDSGDGNWVCLCVWSTTVSDTAARLHDVWRCWLWWARTRAKVFRRGPNAKCLIDLRAIAKFRDTFCNRNVDNNWYRQIQQTHHTQKQHFLWIQSVQMVTAHAAIGTRDCVPGALFLLPIFYFYHFLFVHTLSCRALLSFAIFYLFIEFAIVFTVCLLPCTHAWVLILCEDISFHLSLSLSLFLTFSLSLALPLYTLCPFACERGEECNKMAWALFIFFVCFLYPFFTLSSVHAVGTVFVCPSGRMAEVAGPSVAGKVADSVGIFLGNYFFYWFACDKCLFSFTALRFNSIHFTSIVQHFCSSLASIVLRFLCDSTRRPPVPMARLDTMFGWENDRNAPWLIHWSKWWEPENTNKLALTRWTTQTKGKHNTPKWQ